ncbi:MAG TPA: mechanosensitive ion channel family protein [Polyangiaceae bacterium]|nr:mechanosensitive ion channel family protein [Polyangiaceae bacterium]
MIEWLDAWGFALLGGCLVSIAFLINRFAPARRRRIRHAFFLYLLFLVLVGAERVLAHVHVSSVGSWVEHVHFIAGLMAAFTCVNLGALVVFDLVLPVLGVTFVAITGDLVVGFAYVFAAIGVLKASGVSPSSVLTTSAIVSGVIALSLQATLGNILGGVALQLDGSVHVGDWIELPTGQQGRVIAIRWRHTVVETRNWDTIIVPNANLLAQNIVILGKRSGKPVQHRMWVYFNVDFRFAPSLVLDVVQTALWAAPIEGVAEDPKPSVICYDFAREGRDSFGHYAVRYWLTDLASDDPTSSRIRTRIYTALKRAGIPLARPSQTLFVIPEEDEKTREARHKEQRLHAIEHIDLMAPLTPAEREFVAERLRYATFVAGETITKQGSVAHWLYILCAGSVEVRRHLEGAPLAKKVANITAPGFFGEMGLLTGEPRGADVVAATDVECYRLDKEGLERILHDRPEVAEQMAHTVAGRQVELESVLEELDEQARRARMAKAQTHILDSIQSFFGLTRTSILR